MSQDKLDIVLFPRGSTEGIPASEIELVEENENTVQYLATFIKPNVAVPAEQTQKAAADTVAPLEDVQRVDPEPDTSPTPEGIDYDEMPDLPS